MSNSIRLGGWLAALLMMMQNAVAHEFWLEPSSYRIEPGERLSAHIRVGQHFSGDSQPYLPGNTRRFTVDLAGRSIESGARIGDIPALDLPVKGEGLAILAHVSNDFSLVYRKPGQFQAFLEYDGLLPMLAEHRRRGLPMTGFEERYQRFAKALVEVGTGQGSDRPLGLRFEWVVERNPYLSVGQPLHARLYWQGDPLAGVQARLFIRRGSRVDERVLKTDAEGRVGITAPAGSRLMLNAVRLLEPEAEDASSTAVWKSYWTSISFELP